MAKTLKLGFAMGGGVSLGSFSGSALTESIKLALLYAQDSEGVPYTNIVIDVFAGASADAMSLGVMLKALAFPNKSADARAKAKQVLETQFTAAKIASLTPATLSKLIDAQLTQDLMNDIWVNQIHIDKLLDKTGDDNTAPLKFQCGIANKKAVTTIAKTNLMPESGSFNNNDKAAHPLLAERVLYGCSIANINALHADARALHYTTPGTDVATNDALTSNFHREMRIFDINFTAVTNKKFDTTDGYPSRWMRFHWGKARANKTFDIRSGEHWQHIVATAIASGTFPFAFEPVTLTRYKWEYPEGLWHDKKSKRDYTYMDGGAFNNEAVSEAFKLASHIDALDEGADYERRIIFVDPSVGEKPKMLLPGLFDFKDQTPTDKLWGALSSFDGNDLLRLTSLDKLLANTPSLLTMITGQAEAKIQHRTFQIANQLAFRNKIRAQIVDQIEPSQNTFEELKRLVSERLQEMSHKAPIPTLPASLAGEIERLAREPESLVQELIGLGDAIAKEGAQLADWDVDVSKKIMSALMFSLIDSLGGLEAKSRNSRLIAIGPFAIHAQGHGQKFSPIFLPGSPVAAFAGFMSAIPSDYETRVARFCAFAFMQEAELIDKHTSNPYQLPPAFSEGHPQWDSFMLDYTTGMKKLARRVEDMIKQSHLVDYGFFNGVILAAISSFVSSKIEELKYSQEDFVTLEFRIPVNDKDFELDGKGLGDNDRHPVKIVANNAQLYLVCFAQWDNKLQQWSGYHVKGQKIVIDRDGWLEINDREFVRIPLPSAEAVAASQRLGYPVFTGQHELNKDQSLSKDQLTNYWTLSSAVKPLNRLLLDKK